MKWFLGSDNTRFLLDRNMFKCYLSTHLFSMVKIKYRILHKVYQHV